MVQWFWKVELNIDKIAIIAIKKFGWCRATTYTAIIKWCSDKAFEPGTSLIRNDER